MSPRDRTVNDETEKNIACYNKGFWMWLPEAADGLILRMYLSTYHGTYSENFALFVGISPNNTR